MPVFNFLVEYCSSMLSSIYTKSSSCFSRSTNVDGVLSSYLQLLSLTKIQSHFAFIYKISDFELSNFLSESNSTEKLQNHRFDGVEW